MREASLRTESVERATCSWGSSWNRVHLSTVR